MNQTTKMRYTLLFSILLLIFSTSCNKQKFATTPSLKFVSVNTTELHPQQVLTFTLSFTDAQGDLTDSIFVQKIVPGCPASNFGDPTNNYGGLYALPPFPTSKDQKGNIVVNFLYNVGGINTITTPQCAPQNDTAFFRFALRDKAHHVSDTVAAPKIIIFN